jgi:hypothetical protein
MFGTEAGKERKWLQNTNHGYGPYVLRPVPYVRICLKIYIRVLVLVVQVQQGRGK